MTDAIDSGNVSIIKDNNAKERAGVGDKPPPPNFGRSINPILIQFSFLIQ